MVILSQDEFDEMRRLAARARSELSGIKALLRARRLKFNPDQPRVPAGQREGANGRL